jgi:hypothetical protein
MRSSSPGRSRRIAAALVAFAGVVSAAPAHAAPRLGSDLPGPLAPNVNSHATSGSASTYHPVTPFTAYSPKVHVNAGHSVAIPLAGRGRLPAAGEFNAVAVTVTVSQATKSTTATVVDPGTSNAIQVVSAPAKRSATGFTVVPVASSGMIRARISSGRARLRVVVDGYQTADRTGDSFHSLATATVLAAHRFAGGGSRSINIVGAPRTGLPPNGQVAALALAVTVTRPSATTTVTAYPRGTPASKGTTVVSAHRGVTTSGEAIVAVGSQGEVTLHNAHGHATISAQVEGYWTTDPTGSSFQAVAPAQLIDNRPTANTWHGFAVAGRHGLPSAGRLSAVVLSITTGPTSKAGYVDVAPAAQRSTTTALVSTATHSRVTTTVLARLTGSKLFFFANRRAALRVSVVGWYGNTAGGADLNAGSGECAGALPAGIGFAVIRATDGQPYGSADPACFGVETLEAQQLPAAPEFYLNLADPGKASAHWNAGGPRTCHVTPNYDLGCAYDYGYLAAAQAVSFASSNNAPSRSRWWLDVETDNTWGNRVGTPPSHLAANVADIQGALHYLNSHGYPAGVYTETTWWQAITGSPKGFSHVPVWGGGAGSASQARANCRQVSITGGPALLTQWFTSTQHDHDIAC